MLSGGDESTSVTSINPIIMIYKYSKEQNSVRVCKKDNCIEAKGKNADLLAGAAAIMLLLVGVASIAGATR
jgi:hypothetical protein